MGEAKKMTEKNEIPKKKETPTKRQQEIIENVYEFIKEKIDDLNTHYLSVKTENGQNKINDIYELINEETYKSELLKVSIVILTANYFEGEILNYNASKDSGKKIKKLYDGLQLFDNKHYLVKAYIMEINGYTILHLHAPETGSNTPCGSSDLVRYVGNCEFLEPSCIISFGICYGTDFDEFSLGDTLIAEKIYPWSIGIKISNDGWKIKCDDYVINLKEQNAILYNRVKEVIDSTQNLCPNQKAKMGNMLTAEAVVNNEKTIIDAIQKAYTCNIIGGEMEGYGLAKECIYYNKTSCMILKAICDWGAVKNIDEYICEKMPGAIESYKDKIQAYTTYCAYRTLEELFKRQVFEKNNIILSIHDELIKNYYSDGSISRDVLTNFIGIYLKDNYKKYLNMSHDYQEIFKSIVAKSIICQSFKPFDGGYIFNEHLY